MAVGFPDGVYYYHSIADCILLDVFLTGSVEMNSLTSYPTTPMTRYECTSICREKDMVYIHRSDY